MADVRPYPDLNVSNSPALSDSLLGTKDPTGTPETVNFPIEDVRKLTIKKVTVTVTQAAEPAINTDDGDIFIITGLAQAISSLTTNLTGTPVDGQFMEMRITDNGTARAITPGASYLGTAEFPLAGLTTTISKTLKLLWEYSAALSAWQLVGKLNQA